MSIIVFIIVFIIVSIIVFIIVSIIFYHGFQAVKESTNQVQIAIQEAWIFAIFII